MIFRLTQKLNARIKAGPLETLPLDENPYADWSAALFVAGRTPYILLSNTQSLYSTLLPARGVTNATRFTESASSGIQELLQGEDQSSHFGRFIAPASTPVRFARGLNRSLTGSMNQLIYEGSMWLTEGALSPQQVRLKLNDTLLSYLGSSQSSSYGSPRKAFQALEPGAGS